MKREAYATLIERLRQIQTLAKQPRLSTREKDGLWSLAHGAQRIVERELREEHPAK